MKKHYISYQTAYRLTIDNISILPRVTMSVFDCVGYVSAEDVHAEVDSPSIHMSMKDGYAVKFDDIKRVSNEKPVHLRVTGSISAGQHIMDILQSGAAYRVLTGAKVPNGADTVIAEEFVTISGQRIIIKEPTEAGKNILSRGSDTQNGQLLLKKGAQMTPGKIGYIVSGGRKSIRVYRKPDIAIIATGDEVLLPGQAFSEGRLYASNLITLNSWCRNYGFKTDVDTVEDNKKAIKERLIKAADQNDAILTSGGAWGSDKDLMIEALDELGWEKIYHRIRLGPGKASGFGLLNRKPIFILPGGPPSNLVAFLQLALPGLLRLCGDRKQHLPEIPATLLSSVIGQTNWTQAIFGRLKMDNTKTVFDPDKKNGSRLKSMAEAEALLLIPEGVSGISANEIVNVQVLNPR